LFLHLWVQYHHHRWHVHLRVQPDIWQVQGSEFSAGTDNLPGTAHHGYPVDRPAANGLLFQAPISHPFDLQPANPAGTTRLDVLGGVAVITGLIFTDGKHIRVEAERK